MPGCSQLSSDPPPSPRCPCVSCQVFFNHRIGGMSLLPWLYLFELREKEVQLNFIFAKCLFCAVGSRRSTVRGTSCEVRLTRRRQLKFGPNPPPFHFLCELMGFRSVPFHLNSLVFLPISQSWRFVVKNIF